VRTSRTTRVAGFKIDEELGKKGYTVSVVYLDEESPGSTLGELKDPVGGVIIVVPSEQSEKAVLQAIKAKIPRVWLQKGSESAAAIKLCQDKGITVIQGECLMMFAEPVKSFHAFHRWIWKLQGKIQG
jgi:predicted CoA-binding protein